MRIVISGLGCLIAITPACGTMYCVSTLTDSFKPGLIISCSVQNHTGFPEIEKSINV